MTKTRRFELRIAPADLTILKRQARSRNTTVARLVIARALGRNYQQVRNWLKRKHWPPSAPVPQPTDGEHYLDYGDRLNRWVAKGGTLKERRNRYHAAKPVLEAYRMRKRQL